MDADVNRGRRTGKPGTLSATGPLSRFAAAVTVRRPELGTYRPYFAGHPRLPFTAADFLAEGPTFLAEGPTQEGAS